MIITNSNVIVIECEMKGGKFSVSWKHHDFRSFIMEAGLFIWALLVLSSFGVMNRINLLGFRE